MAKVTQKPLVSRRIGDEIEPFNATFLINRLEQIAPFVIDMRPMKLDALLLPMRENTSLA